MAAPSDTTAKILNLPVEVATAIMRELYRDEVIVLDDVESLSRLGDVASTNESLGVFKIGMLCEELAGRIMAQEAVLEFDGRVNVHQTDLLRLPLLRDVRRLQVNLEHLDFENALGVLSNLPALEEVVVIFESTIDFEDMYIEDWVFLMRHCLRRDYVSVKDLTRSEWKYNLVLRVEFWSESIETHPRCEVAVSKGKIIKLEPAEYRRAEWREALILYLDLDGEEDNEQENQEQVI